MRDTVFAWARVALLIMLACLIGVNAGAQNRAAETSPAAGGSTAMRSFVVGIEQMHNFARDLATVEKYQYDLLRALDMMTASLEGLRVDMPPRTNEQDPRVTIGQFRQEVTAALERPPATDRDRVVFQVDFFRKVDEWLRVNQVVLFPRITLVAGTSRPNFPPYGGPDLDIASPVVQALSRIVDDLSAIPEIQVLGGPRGDNAPNILEQTRQFVRSRLETMREIEARVQSLGVVRGFPSFGFFVPRQEIPVPDVLPPDFFNTLVRPDFNAFLNINRTVLTVEEFRDSGRLILTGLALLNQFAAQNYQLIVQAPRTLGDIQSQIDTFTTQTREGTARLRQSISQTTVEFNQRVQAEKARILDNLSQSLSSSDNQKQSLNLFSYMLIAFVISLLGLHVIIRLFGDADRKIIFSSNSLLHVFTVFTIISAITILAMTDRIQSDHLVTLLAGISGYVLGQLGKSTPAA